MLPFKADTDVTFTVKYDVMPTFELPAYKGLTVTYPKVRVTDEAVNAEIDKLRDQNAMVIDKQDAAAMGDIVTVDYVELDEQNNEVAGTERKEFVFTLGSSYNFYQIDSDLVGMKAGEETSQDLRRTPPWKAMPARPSRSRWLYRPLDTAMFPLSMMSLPRM